MQNTAASPVCLEPPQAAALTRLAQGLVDQQRARVLVPPQQNAAGFWFGGGNLIADGDGGLLLVGRYRNQGDSRTGLAAGERGLELAIFRAASFDGPFEKVRSFTKADLDCGGRKVLSIEGAALRRDKRGIEVFVSTEKDVAYPPEVADFRKPGTGVWSIDRFAAANIDALDASTIAPVLASTDPSTLHVKDPVVFDRANGDTVLIYCTHPFAWSSANTGAVRRKKGADAFVRVTECVLQRGRVWDVAGTRVTDRLPLPRLGLLRGLPPLSLYFYDGAECVRSHQEHAHAVKRPRGYSCEEIGGLAWGSDDMFPAVERLSVNAPLFVSPHGTGCSRYVHALVADDAILAAWQQSQDDLSQPLVGHALPMERVEAILAGRD